MVMKNLSNKVSADDIARTKDIRNPPEFEPGFEADDGGGDGFDDLFDDFEFDDISDGDFGNTNDSSSSGSSSGGTSNPFSSPAQSSPFGASSGLGQQSPFGAAPGSPFGSAFAGQFQQQQQAQNTEPGLYEKAYKAFGEAAVSFGKVMVELFKSIKNRNADDMGYLHRNLLMVGGISVGACILLSIIGWLTKIRFLSFIGLPGQVLVASVLVVGTGVAGLALSAIAIAKSNNDSTGGIEQLPDISNTVDNDFTDDYEENIGDVLDDLFDDDLNLFDELDEDIGDDTDDEEAYTPNFDDVTFQPEEVDYDSKLDEIDSNQIVSREILFNSFKPFFPVHTPSFADRKMLDVNSDEFATIETICLKALSNVCRCEMEEVKSSLESAEESYFSYELRMKRIRGVNKTDEIAREMEAYFRESSTDTSVNAAVDIEGDFYKITITKGVNAIVTFGDVFRQDYVCDFFLNTKNRLPIIVGVDELGNVILDDARPFDTMMIAGKPRSGKSWYVLSVLMSMMMFNSPEDVQFIICDPKKSNLFNTLSLMPHVAGLSDDSNIIEVMEDIINNEGERRKKLLSDNRCDDIWALKKKGINLPVLYLVIDEIITVKSNLASKGEGLDKEFDSLMQVLISQLPFVGIRLIFVPHRATGVVNKTNRTMLQFTAAVRSNPEDVCDTLDIKKWNRSLVNPGDIAVKVSTRENALYVRGASVTSSDEDNTDLIINAARAFYKMGIDIPDMSTLQVAHTRDEEYVKEELSLGNNRVQYDAANILKDLDI